MKPPGIAVCFSTCHKSTTNSWEPANGRDYSSDSWHTDRESWLLQTGRAPGSSPYVLVSLSWRTLNGCLIVLFQQSQHVQARSCRSVFHSPFPSHPAWPSEQTCSHCIWEFHRASVETAVIYGSVIDTTSPTVSRLQNKPMNNSVCKYEW